MNCCTRFCSSLTLADGSKFIATSGFLQNGDLPGMIQVVLDHAVQQEVDRVWLTLNSVIQTLGIESGDGAAQFLMRTFQIPERNLPRRVGGFRNSGPILLRREFERLAIHTAAPGVDPGGDVENDLPDTMNAGHGLCGSL